jgi:hypothetical protein
MGWVHGRMSCNAGFLYDDGVGMDGKPKRGANLAPRFRL